jgi:ribosomal protein S18 acetylase RimI-like enzyme
MTQTHTIRAIRPQEVHFLEEMLYEAVYVPEGEEKPGHEIINIPELSVYFKDFGRKGDLCLVADINGTLAGAVWTRLFTAGSPGFGFVDENTPELSMAVVPNFRRQGIGTSLFEAILHKLTEEGYPRVSLSVDIRNFIYDLYRRSGFETVGMHDQSATMVKQLVRNTEDTPVQ